MMLGWTDQIMLKETEMARISTDFPGGFWYSYVKETCLEMRNNIENRIG